MRDQSNAALPNSKPQKKKQPKRPRKITQSYLRNSGLFYLQRFTASSGHFRTVMIRKVKKSCAYHKDQDIDQCVIWVDELVQTFINEGLLDDAGYLRGMVTSLRRQGKSRKAILMKLQQKQMPSSDIEKALHIYDEENFEDQNQAEFISALKYARKKRMGPFDIKGKYEPEKALNNLARQGFSYDTSRKILALTVQEIEEDYPEYQTSSF